MNCRNAIKKAESEKNKGVRCRKFTANVVKIMGKKRQATPTTSRNQSLHPHHQTVLPWHLLPSAGAYACALQRQYWQ